MREIVISGFAAAGAALALALHTEGIPADALLVVDPDPAPWREPKPGDARIMALNAASCELLERAGVREALRSLTYPMRGFVLSDTALEEAIRPALFELGEAGSGAPIAEMIALPAIIAALRARCRDLGIALLSGRITGFSGEGERAQVIVSLPEGETKISARLVVAADGLASPLRQMAGISVHGWPYRQTAIAATITHSLPHRGEAVQHFLPSGPFALLPLDEGRSSIVWSEREAIAREMLALPKDRLLEEISVRAAGWRGEITGVEALSSHPLRLQLARRFFGPRLALVADAAHVVHPLAGQGLNLGFGDVLALAAIIGERMRHGLDPGAPDGLEAYQAARRPPTLAMAATTETINRLFSNDVGPLRLVRDLGLGLVQRFPGLKSRIIHAASGL